jgi:hypothetical protein
MPFEGDTRDFLKAVEAVEVKDYSKFDRSVLEDAFGVPAEHLERKVSVYKPPKTATQHGWGVSNGAIHTHLSEHKKLVYEVQ